MSVRLGARRVSFVSGALAMSVALAACGSAPDESSGGDEFRNEAQAMPLDEWTTGELARGSGDTTDWKAVDTTEAGKLAVELKTDKKSAVVQVGVFDKYGQAIGYGMKKGADPVSVPVNAKYAGRYFVRIVHKDGDKTAYSVRAVMGESGGGKDPVPDL